ncbi:MAG: glycosyltransferase [Candidatus Aminicenantia bacterium]
MIFTLQVIILIVLIILFLNLLNNLKILKKPDRLGKKEKNLPLISVLIPARNEERNIKKCLLSLLKQDYPRLEIIVLDDDSRDRTSEIVKQLAVTHKKLKLVKGKELPENWTGKNWACHQLSQIAKGEWLVFTDADTRHKSTSISSAYQTAIRNNSPFFSYIPGLITKKISEALLLPIIHFAFFVFLPLGLISRSSDPRLSLAVGPFIIIQKDFYLKIGGHEKIKNEIVDDLALAKRVKANQGKIVLADGGEEVKVRFYRGFREIWKGFSKNAYGAFGDSPQVVIPFLALNYFLFIYPYLSFFQAVKTSNLASIPALQVIIISLMRILLAIRFKTSMFLGLFHPVAVFIWSLITLNSLRLWLVKKGVEWKERFYPID